MQKGEFPDDSAKGQKFYVVGKCRYEEFKVSEQFLRQISWYGNIPLSRDDFVVSLEQYFEDNNLDLQDLKDILNTDNISKFFAELWEKHAETFIVAQQGLTEENLALVPGTYCYDVKLCKLEPKRKREQDINFNKTRAGAFNELRSIISKLQLNRLPKLMMALFKINLKENQSDFRNMQRIIRTKNFQDYGPGFGPGLEITERETADGLIIEIKRPVDFESDAASSESGSPGSAGSGFGSGSGSDAFSKGTNLIFSPEKSSGSESPPGPQAPQNVLAQGEARVPQALVEAAQALTAPESSPESSLESSENSPEAPETVDATEAEKRGSNKDVELSAEEVNSLLDESAKSSVDPRFKRTKKFVHQFFKGGYFKKSLKEFKVVPFTHEDFITLKDGQAKCRFGSFEELKECKWIQYKDCLVGLQKLVETSKSSESSSSESSSSESSSNESSNSESSKSSSNKKSSSAKHKYFLKAYVWKPNLVVLLHQMKQAVDYDLMIWVPPEHAGTADGHYKSNTTNFKALKDIVLQFPVVFSEQIEKPKNSEDLLVYRACTATNACCKNHAKRNQNFLEANMLRAGCLIWI